MSRNWGETSEEIVFRAAITLGPRAAASALDREFRKYSINNLCSIIADETYDFLSSLLDSGGRVARPFIFGTEVVLGDFDTFALSWPLVESVVEFT